MDNFSCQALSLSGRNVGERVQTPSGAPRLTGVVERIHQDATQREVVLRLEQPGDGIAVLGTYRMGDEARVSTSIFFYGDDANELADAEQARWTTWLDDRF
jgi:hypothetical protein